MTDSNLLLKMFEDELKLLEKEEVIRFSCRCSLRMLPILGYYGDFKKVFHFNEKKSIYDLFYAIDLSYAITYNQDLVSFDSIKEAAQNAAMAANRGIGSTIFSLVAFSAADAAYTAETINDPKRITVKRASRNIATIIYLAEHSNYYWLLNDISSDLEMIKSRKNEPLNFKNYIDLWPKFKNALYEIEGKYWVDVCVDYFENNFHINADKVFTRLKVPKSIRLQGISVVGRYLTSLEKGRKWLDESRIIILGDKGSGKTSLARRLQSIDSEMPSIQESTPGVDTLFWKIENNNEPIQARIWDFAGHTVTHAAHQFFLSERCLYILVYDGRTDRQDRLDYWLQHMENYGGKESKALILVNKRDRHAVKLKENYLKRNYQIEGIYYFSIQDDFKELEQFRFEVADYLVNNPSWSKQQIPISFYKVKEELESLFQEASKDDCIDFIKKDQFEVIAKKHEIDDSNFLLDALHHLGISLWYKQMEKYNTLVLNPEWITFGVYRLINWAANQNRFDLYLKDFKTAFSDEIARYPSEMSHEFLFDLMKHYELAYQAEGLPQLIIPHLLQEDLPDGLPTFPEKDTLKERYKADQPLLPNTISRFIVRHHKQIKDPNWLWRYGVILEDGKGSTALIEEEDRMITVSVVGVQKTEFITTLRGTLNDIFKDYQVKKPELQYKIERGSTGSSELAGSNTSNELWLSEATILSHAAEKQPILDPDTRKKIHPEPIVLQYQMTVNVFSEREIIPILRQLNSKVETLISTTFQIQSELTDIGTIILQEVKTLQNDLFDNRMEERQFFSKLENYIFNLPVDQQPEDPEWFDQPAKKKLKMTIPLLLFKYEQEYDLTNAKLPKSWKEFKQWFLKEV